MTPISRQVWLRFQDKHDSDPILLQFQDKHDSNSRTNMTPIPRQTWLQFQDKYYLNSKTNMTPIPRQTWFNFQELCPNNGSTVRRGLRSRHALNERSSATAHLSASRIIHASEASPQVAVHSPAGSSLPSQQSHTPSPTLDDGIRTGRCPRLAHSNTPAGDIVAASHHSWLRMIREQYIPKNTCYRNLPLPIYQCPGIYMGIVWIKYWNTTSACI